MQKSEITIAIVDDDMSFGKAVQEALVREGYKALHFPKPQSLESMIHSQPVHFVLIDCLLPKTNGRELAVKLRKEFGESLPMAMTSGILRDKGFIRETLLETKAQAFLSKPFPVEELLKEIEKATGYLEDVEMPPLHELLGNTTPRSRAIISAINNSEEIHGYDIPWILCLLCDPRIAGILNLVTPDNRSTSIGYSKGSIVQINQSDENTHLGVLLIERGLVTNQEIEEVVGLGKTARKLGQLLVEKNLVSPHVIDVILADQQTLRLGKLVAPLNIKVNFTPSTDVTEVTPLSNELIHRLLNDWVTGKLPADWLRTLYSPWMRHQVVKGPRFNSDHPALSLSVVLKASNLFPCLSEAVPLEVAIAKSKHLEDDALRALHVFVCLGLIRFGPIVNDANVDLMRRRFSKLNEDLKRQNFFERLSISPNARDVDAKRNYHEIIKSLHPDKLGENLPSDILALAKSCYSMVQEAYDVLSEASSRKEYQAELEQNRAQDAQEAEYMRDEARKLMTRGDFSGAIKLIDSALELVPLFTDAKLIRLWIQIKMLPANMESASSKAALAKMSTELESITLDERQNPLYYFVRGLVQKALKDMDVARRAFEQAVAMDPRFIDAKRELNLLQIQVHKSENKPIDLLRGDLTQVVGQLLSRGKKK